MEIHALSAATTHEMVEKLAGLAPDFVSVHLNCEQPPMKLDGEVALHGATSCLGAMTHEGVHDGVTAFVIEDGEGSYGTATAEYGADPVAAAEAATQQALKNADRFGETPDLVWVAATPGVEEDVLKGIQEALGDEVPIIGGSAADNSVEGNWFVFDAGAVVKEGLVVTVLFPSKPISFAYQNGYSPTERHGVVTHATGRTIHQIDNRPAMDVFSEWTGSAIAPVSAADGTRAILSDSTLWPLGRETNKVHGIPFYLLAHPATGHANGDIDLFATVAEGETLTQMSGTIDSLTDRAGRVASLARKLGPRDERPIAGALMIYCGGCMLTVRDELSRVVDGVNDALGTRPFLGAFTFGEQGSLMDEGNRHGNLMISCIVFEA